MKRYLYKPDSVKQGDLRQRPVVVSSATAPQNVTKTYRQEKKTRLLGGGGGEGNLQRSLSGCGPSSCWGTVLMQIHALGGNLLAGTLK